MPAPILRRFRLPNRPKFTSLEDVERYEDALQVAIMDYARDSSNWLDANVAKLVPWTPTDGSGAGLGFVNVTASSRTIGNGLVIAHCALQFPATISGANATIDGLPFPIGTPTPVAVVYTTDATATIAVGSPGTTLISLAAAAGGAARTNVMLTGDIVAFTLVYER